MKLSRSDYPASPDQIPRGFTFVELLVVLGVIGIVVVTLLPALAGTRANSGALQCLNNVKQLTAGWAMYATDSNDRMLDGSRWVWGSMNGTITPGAPWASSGNETNAAYMLDPTSALIAPYCKSAAIFKCPGDTFQAPANPGPRIRSYSMNAAAGGSVGTIGGTYAASDPGSRTYIKNTQFQRISRLNKPGPSKVWVMLEEHPDCINDGTFQFRPGYQQTAYQWQDLPGSLHNGGCGISFADGHSIIKQWSDSRTTLPVTLRFKWWQGGGGGTYAVGLPKPSPDYAWMNEGMPYE